MKGFIKVWRHCLRFLLTNIKIAGEHRMVSRTIINPADPLDWTYMHTKWSCSCGYEDK